MSLISILLITVAILSFSFGLLTLIGASKSDRMRSAWFCFATLGAAIWSVSIAVFLALTNAEADPTWCIYGIYIPPMFMMVGMLGYASWRRKGDKVLTILDLLFMLVLAVLMIYDHNLLYESYEISYTGNTVTLVKGAFYAVYMIFYVVSDTAFLLYSLYTVRHTRNKSIRNGNLTLMIGFAITGVVTLVTDLFLPLFGNYSLIWIGPLFISVTIAVYFYAVLKYHMISVASRWLQMATYAVVGLAGVAIYMVLFYIIFTTLFKIPNPSASVLVLNFLMIVIVVLLMPVVREVSAALRSMIMVGQVDIAYVIKKLNKLATRNVDLRELAGFLADHLHFAYIGFIINGKLYGSKSLAMSADEILQITHMKSTARGEVWQEPNAKVKKILDDLDLKAVAELRNAKGKAFGQIVVGKPLGKSSFERRDLIQLEMMINLVATVIDSEKHIRA